MRHYLNYFLIKTSNFSIPNQSLYGRVLSPGHRMETRRVESQLRNHVGIMAFTMYEEVTEEADLEDEQVTDEGDYPDLEDEEVTFLCKCDGRGQGRNKRQLEEGLRWMVKEVRDFSF